MLGVPRHPGTHPSYATAKRVKTFSRQRFLSIYGTLCFYVGCIEDEIEVWMDNAEKESPVSNYAELLHDNTSHSQSLTLVDWILIFVQFLRFKYGISDAITGLLLRFFKTFFMVLERFSDICKISDSLHCTLCLT